MRKLCKLEQSDFCKKESLLCVIFTPAILHVFIYFPLTPLPLTPAWLMLVTVVVGASMESGGDADDECSSNVGQSVWSLY